MEKGEVFTVGEENLVEGVIVNLTDSKVTLETSFGWCILPLFDRTAWPLFEGARVSVKLNGMRVVEVKIWS